MLGGLAAGVLDIGYAFVVYGPLSYGLSPMQVLQSMEAGWIGREASAAVGWNTALWGLGTHFMLATVMACAYVLAATRLAFLRTGALLWGFAYGLVLYVAINYVVAPLSAAHASGHFAASVGEALERLGVAFSALKPRDPLQLAGTIFTHTVFVGMPIALINKKFTAA